ncbi:hypothetical protein [Propioniciclava tarda]|uniref:Uncharacterized protein n=1 Tax=Propioniciclava tarda TaxID=433330 RepID=A0A4Q9KN49_PROTD|nr:hypothetical protein [Propioniciclava tarda]TBT95695.1 hypothetical protein ET996_04425 [Propioniciclava tarda]
MAKQVAGIESAVMVTVPPAVTVAQPDAGLYDEVLIETLAQPLGLMVPLEMQTVELVPDVFEKTNENW